jgi:hypothetical protein
MRNPELVSGPREARDTPPPVSCCTGHPSITVLADHLVSDYRRLGTARVLGALVEAHRTCEGIGLPYVDVLRTVELMTRHNLADQHSD